MHRAAALSRARAVPRLRRGAVWGCAVLGLLVAGFFWLRDSSLVTVKQVTVTGLTGPEAARLTARLTAAARDMTTLHVREDQLRDVVRPFPVVKAVSAQADFPHTLRITVTENVPVAVVLVNGAKIPVAGDGLLLRDAQQRQLPVVPMRGIPGGDRVADRAALRAIELLAAAPAALRERAIVAGTTPAGGLTVALREGPELRFGAVDRLKAKWAAAAAVLADQDSVGARYLDLRYPERPAAGGLENPATQQDPRTVNAASSTAPETAITPGAGPTASTSTP